MHCCESRYDVWQLVFDVYSESCKSLSIPKAIAMRGDPYHAKNVIRYVPSPAKCDEINNSFNAIIISSIFLPTFVTKDRMYI